MRIRWLGWAGVELEHEGRTLVIDALQDAHAVFAPLADRAPHVPAPTITPPQPHTAAAALVTHLHRDHADAAAIVAALESGAQVFGPPDGGGDRLENLGLLQAEHEFTEHDLERVRLEPWATAQAGPFRITALPAADGTGDPQVSWLVEAGGTTVAHFGDTLFHGYWWRIARRLGAPDVAFLPVNAATVDFPHRQPATDQPIVMDPEQAAAAAQILRPRLALPMHDAGYETPGLYTATPDAADRFVGAATTRGITARRPTRGEWIDLADEFAVHPESQAA